MKNYSTFFFGVTEVSNKMRTAVSLGALVLFCLMQSVNIQAQTTLLSPTGDGGFENGATFAANGWTLVNGATNQWWAGAVSVPSAGTNAAYVSDDVAGATWNYNVNSASTVHFYRDITFPAGLTNIVLSFKWKGQGESSYDYLTVYSIPTSTTPTFNNPAGGFQSWTSLATAYPGATILCTPPNLNLQATYQTQTACIPSSFAGTTQRIVFMWSNDGSLGTVPPISVDEISIVASTAPTAPANSPTALVLTPFSNAQINGSFTAAAGSPDAYLVVRYPAGAAVTNPVNGTTYTAGTSLGLGRVVSAGASTTFSATGLTPSTAYDFYVYSYNLAPCASGPLYRTTSPLTGTASTLGCTGLAAGTYTVGPTGTYASLTAVNAALVNGTAGPVIFELQSTYVSTVETFPVTFNSSPCPFTGGVIIRPQTGATALSITSANATGTISFDGGSNITIDGRAGGVGAPQLTISNTTTTGYSIQFINSASFNTIRYCTVAGVNTGTASGVIVFNTATGLTTGNSNNTIDNCDIRDGATTPLNLIWATGTTTNGYNNLNNNNTISNCTLHDWFSASSTTAGAAINIVAGCSDWTITGNSFYQTATRTFTMTSATDQGAIFVASTVFGQNFTITNNFIGGTAPLCGGTPWTWTGGATGTPTPRLIRFSVSNGLPLSNISNNTIANIAITTSSTSTSSSLISHLNGNVNISNNTLGSQTATGNVTFTLAATSTAPFFLAISSGTGANPSTINITNNNIGGITVSTNSTGAVSFRVIYSQPVAGSNVTISNNLVGGTVANSIQQLTGTATAQIGALFGILVLNPTIGNLITNNTVRNLTINNVNAGPFLSGINIQSSGGGHTITGNTIFNLTTNVPNVAINNISSIVGLNVIASAVGGTNVSNNTVYNLSNTNTAAATWVNGLYFGTALTPAQNTTISRNFVHSLNVASAVSGAGMAGIFLPNTGNALVYNNTVRLGIDINGASLTNALQINGIYKVSSGSMGIYHNTVYIGGTGVVSGTANTFAFRRAAAPTIGQDTVVNNIFYNARSNASGTGKNYAVTQFANTTLLENNNVLLADGTGGVLGLFNVTDCATLAAWQTASNADWNSLVSDPKLVNPTGSLATIDLHIQAAVVTPVERGGINIPLVSTDFDGQTRSGLTPVDIGADAGNFLLADLTGPVITYNALLNTNCNTGDQTLTGVNISDATGIPTTGTLRPRIYYRKNAGAYFSQPGTLASGSATNSNWNFTIVAADMGGLVATDVVSYYVIAQDIVATPNIGSSPAGVIATDVNTVTTHPIAPNTYTINATSLSGTYTVGAAGTYPTLTAAVAAYNSACLGGPVTFNLIDANYAGETFPITINANAFASATNTLTIKATQANTTISGTSATAMIVFNGADWVTIDGSIS
ncbi:MAG: hypothetical protein KGS48_12620, partial [Bacteroidetes bacterium]|nr:hypothetical protein [Bacteroidota bacterium]